MKSPACKSLQLQQTPLKSFLDATKPIIQCTTPSVQYQSCQRQSCISIRMCTQKQMGVINVQYGNTTGFMWAQQYHL